MYFLKELQTCVVGERGGWRVAKSDFQPYVFYESFALPAHLLRIKDSFFPQHMKVRGCAGVALRKVDDP